MQEKIDRFNAAFVDMAADYVERLRLKIAQASAIRIGEKKIGAIRIDEPDWKIPLPDQVRIADCLAVSVGRIEDRMRQKRDKDADKLDFLRDFLEGKTRWTFPEGATFNVTIDASSTSGMETTLKSAEKEPPAGPEPVVKLGPGASFRQENTPIHGQYPAPDSVKVEAVERLQDLCSFCKEMKRYRDGDSVAAGRQYRLIRGRAWGIDVAMLEFAISVFSELREIKEIRIPAEPNTPGAWELMRDILAGRRPAPEGTVFDVVIDMTGNPQAIRNREEPEPAPRMLAIAMPGGETVKLNSAAEAYRLAGCIEDMAARVWPEVVPGK